MKTTRLLILSLFLLSLLAGCAPAATPAPTAAAATIPPAISPTGTSLPVSTALPAATVTPASTPTPTFEPPRILWDKTYGKTGADTGESLLADGAGGAYLFGTAHFDLYGKGASGEFNLMRVDSAGNTLWEKTYSSGQPSTGISITRTADGNLLLAGTSQSPVTGADVYLVKVDPQGSEIWSRTFEGPLDEMASASALADGSFMLWGNSVDPKDIVADSGAAGYGGYSGRSHIYLAKMDADGNLAWSKTFGGKNNLVASGGVPAADGGFVVLATLMRYPQPDDDAYLLKLDANGEIGWERTWEEGSIVTYDLLRSADNQYLIAASTAPARNIDFLFIKVDDQGQETWRSTFGDPKMMDYPMRVIQTADGGYIAAGDWIKDFSGQNPGEVSITKIDANGQLLWEKTVKPGGRHNVLRGWLQQADGSYWLTGSRFGQGSEVYLLSISGDTAAGSGYLSQTPPGLTPQVFAPGLVSVEKAVDFAITFAPDGQELYFTRRLDGGKNALYEAHLTNGAWTEPAPVTFATEYPAFEPHISADNKTLYFGWIISMDKDEIWAVDRVAEGWSQPRRVGDGMFASSDQDGQFYVTSLPSQTLVKVGIENGLFANPTTIGSGVHPAIAPDGSYLISDNGDGNLIVRFLQADGSWGAPKSLSGTGIPVEASIASISPDGKYLFYTYQQNIYWVSTDILAGLK